MRAASSRRGGTALSQTLRSWRERFKRWTKPPRRITFTRAGKFFMLLTLAVGAAALNTGNNLLFLLLGMMLSTIIASGILSEAVLRKLNIKRLAPARLAAGRFGPGGFEVHNPRGYASLNVEASEQNATQVTGPKPGRLVGHKDLAFYKFWRRDAFDQECYVAIARMPEIAAGARHVASARYLFPERGVYRSPGMRLATRFPFGIFHKVRDVESERHFVVYPASRPAETWAAQITAHFGEISRNKAGLGQDYFGLRDWREGEDQRAIHWKSSARRDALVMRDFEDQEQRAVEILVVNSTAGLGQEHKAYQGELFEHNLSRGRRALRAAHRRALRRGAAHAR